MTWIVNNTGAEFNNGEHEMTWIETGMGFEFDFAKPASRHVVLHDIAHSLSNIKRFNGHTNVNCSVALHSVIMSHIVPEEYAKHALLHDAHEAYTGDISSPLKQLLGQSITDIENRIDVEVSKRFGVELRPCSVVKKFDLRCLAYEKYHFLQRGTSLWPCLKNVENAVVPSSLVALYYEEDCAVHRKLFFQRCDELGIR